MAIVHRKIEAIRQKLSDHQQAGVSRQLIVKQDAHQQCGHEAQQRQQQSLLHHHPDEVPVAVTDGLQRGKLGHVVAHVRVDDLVADDHAHHESDPFAELEDEADPHAFVPKALSLAIKSGLVQTFTSSGRMFRSSSRTAYAFAGSSS